MLTDRTGREITKGSYVDFSLAGNVYNAYVGQVVESSLVTAEGERPQQPFVMVSIVLQLTAAPNGIIPGVYVISQAPPDTAKDMVS